jgi:hypothetical protein
MHLDSQQNTSGWRGEIYLTKYYQDKNRFRKDDDTPISLRDYSQIDSHNERYCPYCQLKLSRLIDSSGLNPSWYCSKCVIDYPDKTETKSRSSLSTPQQKSNNENPAVAYAPDPTVGKKPVEPKGTFATLKSRGIRITSYKEEGHIS